MKFIKLVGIGGHHVLINVANIRDVRHWPGPTAAAIITDDETYLVQQTVNEVAEKLASVGRVS